MHPSHEPWLVALSFFVAFQGSHVGLHFARLAYPAAGLRRRFLITAAALTLALGIWTMHFVGILAVRLPVAVDFLVLPTLLSFLVCVLVVGFAVFAVGASPARPMRIGLAAVFMGAGIVTMHYIGMSALHASLHMTHAPLWVAASVLVSVAASGIALWLGFGSGLGPGLGSRLGLGSITGATDADAKEANTKGAVLLPAVLLGLAIPAMHYAAMAGLTFHPHEAAVPVEVPAFSPGLLAIVVSIVAFLVSGLFLLTLIPEGASPLPKSEFRQSQSQPAPPDPEAPPDDLPAKQEPGPRVRTLPVEKDGLQGQFDVAHLVAVQAQAHYTQLFDGETLWFCPLPISAIEAALDPAVFARVHRSHIINLDRVSALKGTADAAAVDMTARTPYRAPISRARLRLLKQRLGERLHPARA
jgi:NO-binding membrane sensor protein with MHYT domain